MILDIKSLNKGHKMSERNSQRKLSTEAAAYLSKKSLNLTDSEYYDLAIMLGSKSKIITLDQAKSMLYNATHMKAVV